MVGKNPLPQFTAPPRGPMLTCSMPHLLVVVRGRVQGVGFRYFVLKRARERGLKGQVRNRPDGAVEAEAEGARAALESWLEQLRQGPTGARVEAFARPGAKSKDRDSRDSTSSVRPSKVGRT